MAADNLDAAADLAVVLGKTVIADRTAVGNTWVAEEPVADNATNWSKHSLKGCLAAGFEFASKRTWPLTTMEARIAAIEPASRIAHS